jgi:hypothetical protein
MAAENVQISRTKLIEIPWLFYVFYIMDTAGRIKERRGERYVFFRVMEVR